MLPASRGAAHHQDCLRESDNSRIDGAGERVLPLPLTKSAPIRFSRSPARLTAHYASHSTSRILWCRCIRAVWGIAN